MLAWVMEYIVAHDGNMFKKWGRPMYFYRLAGRIAPVFFALPLLHVPWPSRPWGLDVVIKQVAGCCRSG